MAKTMLVTRGLPKNFWVEPVNSAYDILNMVLIRPLTYKTLYKLIRGKKS